MSLSGVRVVKVGGSLFTWESMPSALTSWLERQPSMQSVLVAGGGQLAETVRVFDDRFHIGDEAAHWVCVDLLRATARMLASSIKNVVFVTQWSDLTQLKNRPNCLHAVVFDPVEFLTKVEHSLSGSKLPRSWETTSDSIAARIAEGLSADELVLLKSFTPGNEESLESLAQHGVIDKFFPHAAKTLPNVRVVNLREPLDELAFVPEDTAHSRR